MKSLAPLAKLILFAALAALPALSSAQAQTSPSEPSRAFQRPLNLLVLGDSIAWGQGLKDEHKTWYLIKQWLEQDAGREVRERIEAHSGALIGSPGSSTAPLNAFDGELSRPVPTVNDQVDDALKNYPDATRVNLVLVDGCINDLDFRQLLNAANTTASIGELARAKCGSPVENLLSRIVEAFPAAHVVITGYYPIVSEKTPHDLFMRALAKRFYAPEPGATKMDNATVRARLIGISREWYQTSNQMLATVAHNVDVALAGKGSHQRVLFVDVGFRPDYSFGTKESRLWGFDGSALRKMLVLLTLGKVQLRTNDERRSYRSDLCRNFFQRQQSETSQQKATREDQLTRCRLAAAGHPNRKGAAMYADAISRLLKPLIAESGWLEPRAPAGNPLH